MMPTTLPFIQYDAYQMYHTYHMPTIKNDIYSLIPTFLSHVFISKIASSWIEVFIKQMYNTHSLIKISNPVQKRRSLTYANVSAQIEPIHYCRLTKLTKIKND